MGAWFGLRGSLSSWEKPALRTPQESEADSGGVAGTHARTHCLQFPFHLASTDSAGLWGRHSSLLGLVLLARGLCPGEDSLIEQQVGAGRQHLLQAGLADRVVGHPQPLVAGGQGVLGGRRGPPVGHEVSGVHVSVVDDYCHQPEEVRGGAAVRNHWEGKRYWGRR